MARADWRKLMSGKDGKLFVDDENGVQQLMGSVKNFHIMVNHSNIQEFFIGDINAYEIPGSIAKTLNFTELVVEDVTLFNRYIDSITNNTALIINVEGVAQRRTMYRSSDFQEQRVRATECIPTGQVDILKVSGHGEVIQRDWSYFINGKIRTNATLS